MINATQSAEVITLEPEEGFAPSIAMDLAQTGVACQAEPIATAIDEASKLTLYVCEDLDRYRELNRLSRDETAVHAIYAPSYGALEDCASFIGHETRRDTTFFLFGSDHDWRVKTFKSLSDHTNNDILWVPVATKTAHLSELSPEEFAELVDKNTQAYIYEPKRSERASELKSRLIALNSAEAILDTAYLIKNWLGSGTMSVIFGPSNVGKTFVALDLAMHVAAGKKWRGYRVNGGPVLYIAAEGGSGVINRVAALRLEHPEFADALFTLLPTALDLHSEADAQAICDMLDEPPALIVVDTLARSMGEGDENSTKDMGAFVRNCDLLRQKTGAHVLVVHHSGKDETRGARGAYALKAALDTEIRITSEREIVCTKQRDMAIGDPVHFALRTVSLGHGGDGDEVTSCVVEAADPPSPKRKPLSGKNQVAMSALFDAIRDNGQRMLGSDYPAECVAAHIDHWREACSLHGLTKGSSESAARTAFMRAKDRLLELNEIRIFGDYVWRVQDD